MSKPIYFQLTNKNLYNYIGFMLVTGGVAQMVERSLSMREVPGSIPGISKLFRCIITCWISISNGPYILPRYMIYRISLVNRCIRWISRMLRLYKRWYGCRIGHFVPIIYTVGQFVLISFLHNELTLVGWFTIKDF